jgi:hypothetical protein
VDDLKLQFIVMGKLVLALLQREQFIGAQILLVDALFWLAPDNMWCDILCHKYPSLDYVETSPLPSLFQPSSGLETRCCFEESIAYISHQE